MPEYDTLDEFKASIRKNNQEQLDKQDDLAVENALVDQVIEGMEAEIPPQALLLHTESKVVDQLVHADIVHGLRDLSLHALDDLMPVRRSVPRFLHAAG